MTSLSAIVNTMDQFGGWLNRSNGEILKKVFVRNDDGHFRYVIKDKNGVVIDEDDIDNQYIRIPQFGSGMSYRCAIRKYRINEDILHRYGILEYMNDDYPVLVEIDEMYYISERERLFCSRAMQLLGDYFFELPTLRECGMEEVLGWCNNNNIEIVDDYIEIE
ncbi:MAG: hypothetical protein ACOYI5_06200 [Christensenellales bacterium]|jgi:hypothetical protein